jgi:hypothetical protein
MALLIILSLVDMIFRRGPIAPVRGAICQCKVEKLMISPLLDFAQEKDNSMCLDQHMSGFSSCTFARGKSKPGKCSRTLSKIAVIGDNRRISIIAEERQFRSTGQDFPSEMPAVSARYERHAISQTMKAHQH